MRCGKPPSRRGFHPQACSPHRGACLVQRLVAAAWPQHGRRAAAARAIARAGRARRCRSRRGEPARLRLALTTETASNCARCLPQQAPASELSGGLTEDEAVANIIKAVMGAGVFSLPWAVAQGGIVFVPAFIMAAAALALHTLSMLVAAKRKILQLRPDAAAQARHGRGCAARRRPNAVALCSRCRATPASWRRRWARSVDAPQRRARAAVTAYAASSLTVLHVSACR